MNTENEFVTVEPVKTPVDVLIDLINQKMDFGAYANVKWNDRVLDALKTISIDRWKEIVSKNRIPLLVESLKKMAPEYNWSSQCIRDFLDNRDAYYRPRELCRILIKIIISKFSPLPITCDLDEKL